MPGSVLVTSHTPPAARPLWEARYCGLPFRDGGRDMTGVDCWGLVRLIYRCELALELPSYGEISAKQLIAVHRQIDADKDGQEWEPVEFGEIQPFDVVVMTRYGTTRVGHVGIVTNKRKLMHVELGCNVVVVPFDHMQVRERIVCIRRNRELSQSGKSLSR